MKILLVGSGGREHALAWKLLQSPLCERLLVAPGNPGIAELGAFNAGRASCVPVKADDVEGLLALALRESVGLVVCGPEAPLVAGLGDACRARGIPFFGPSKAAAEVEGSKNFAKGLMAKAGIPTAAYGTFSDVDAACAFIDRQPGNVVVKADGLCAGKGVEVTDSHDEAKAAVRRMLGDRIFGAAGAQVVIEERLTGRETSMLAICDGERFVLLDSSEDHKAIFDGDRGPNTGGMGAYCPSPLVSRELTAKIAETIFTPMVRALNEAGCKFQGLLYGGLILTPDRGPMVIEWNCRFGDPETQVVLARLQDDLVPWFLGAANGRLPEGVLRFLPGTSVCVVLAAGGYPGKIQTGQGISGIPPVSSQDPSASVLVFHAGTSIADNQLVTAGGRVLGVTAVGTSLNDARARAYAAADAITFEGKQLRRDIGLRA
jgi:phosphoribosylamine---glycine ligase